MRLLITGASRGLGAVAADYFKDYDILLMSRSGIADSPHKVIGADFKDWQTIDCVLHTAGGGMGLRHPILQAGELYKLFRLNIGDSVEVNQRVLPHMKERKQGRIVHVCSIASGEALGSVGYNTVKGALAAYVRSLGREMAPFGIVVSGIAPGAFQCAGNAMDRLERQSPHVHREFVEERLPRGVMGRAEELLPVIRLLLSEEASMMGGTVIAVDAGEGRYYSTL